MMVFSPEEEEAFLNAEPVNLEGREAEVKQAQKRVGELLWLTGRSRPDLQYITSIMSSRITRVPELVNELGERLLDYLAETQYYRLKFVKSDDVEQRLDIFTDSSFATSSGRSHGCAAVFWGTSPISWRSSRQQLITLSTAESEMVEAVDGTTLGLATKCLLQELLGRELPMYLHIDNQAAISLIGGSSASWRTRHLRLRSNWVRERVMMRELYLQHEPGETQRADLGTKALPKDRLKKLVELWGVVDRRPPRDPSVRRATTQGAGHQGWLSKLVMFCQVCGTAASEQNTIQPEIAWDLYLVVAVLAIAVIGLWEAFKFCWRKKEARLRALRVKANKATQQKLTKAELKELQRILALNPEDLTVDQKHLASPNTSKRCTIFVYGKE
ncbi:GIP [Symbiodinium sp. CCMP2592]|nr:GIP [Symbiodinium sp. CCMP2592]